MAVMIVCDGCGKPARAGERFVERGYRGDAAYCESCEPLVAEYSAKFDALHTLTARRFRTGSEALRRRYAKIARMPNEPIV